MPSALAFTEPVREFFTQRRAEAAAQARDPAQQRLVEKLARAGARRLWAGRRVSDPVAASVLLREAVTQLAQAVAVSADPSAVEADLARRPVELPVLPPDPARPRADPSDDTRVRDAIASDDPRYFDALEPEDAERARWALDRAAGALRRLVDPRSVTHVRADRWGRRLAILVVLLWTVVAVLRAELSPKNIALGKPVHPSSQKAPPPDGQTITDGDTGTSVGVHTNTEDDPNVVIDLEAQYWVSRVEVYNRVDGWFDDCLPLALELSTDGKEFKEVARRTDAFGTSPPWTIDVGGRPARYVRLRVTRKSYLALSEVKVFGKP